MIFYALFFFGILYVIGKCLGYVNAKAAMEV